VLASLRGITPRKLHALAWSQGAATDALLAVASGRASSPSDAVRARRISGDRVEADALAQGLRLVVPGSAEYIAAIEDLPDPPVALFVRGRPLTECDPAVSIVGARRCSSLGDEVARGIGRDLAAAGVCVVSGAARGIDRAAHEGALMSDGPTIAVLGCGVDRVSHSAAGLLERIEASGAVVTEYPPGVPAEPHHFPARNRIVAALGRAVVIVEGAERSGTLITTDHALSIGRDVFAVPGPITNPLSTIPLRLIREGARVIRGAEDLLEDLRIDSIPPAARGRAALRGDERDVFDRIVGAELLESLAQATSLPLARVMAVVTSLELKGLVRSYGGRVERRLGT
jgi:DNA processing protein